MARLSVRNRNEGKKDKNGKDKKPNWEYRFEMAPVDGKRKQASKSGFRTQKEAEAAGTAAMAEYLDGGRFHRPTEMSVADYLDEWMASYVLPNLRRNTIDDYESMVRLHIKPALGHYRLKSLNPSTCQTWANEYKEKGFSKRYVLSILACLRGALDYAVLPLGHIKDNPMTHVKCPKIEKQPRKRICISNEDWARIVEKFPFTNRYHIPLMIGYHAGLRISETFALTWDDIDLEAGTISVNKQIMSERTNKYQPVDWLFYPTKTNASNRVVRIGGTLLETLKRERLRQRQNRLAYGEHYRRFKVAEINGDRIIRPDDDGTLEMVSVDVDGSLVTPNSFRYASRLIREDLGIQFEFHALRHTHATILATNGANPKSLQHRLGHEKIETTLNIYVHHSEELAEQAVDIFEKAIGGQR